MFRLTDSAHDTAEAASAVIEPALRDLFAADGGPWTDFANRDVPLELRGPLESQWIPGEEFLLAGVSAEVPTSLTFFLGAPEDAGFRPLATVSLIGIPEDLSFSHIQRSVEEDEGDRMGLLVDRVLRRETEARGDRDFTLRLAAVPEACVSLVVSEVIGGGEAHLYELDLALPSQLPEAVRRVSLVDLQDRVRWAMTRREADGDGRETSDEG